MASIPIRVEEEPFQNMNADNELEVTALPQIIQAKLPNWLHSPILRYLPPEIISVVFTLTLPDVSFFRYFLTKNDSRSKKDWTTTPFILGAVCKDWREITWTTPVLWSSIIVHLTKYTIKTRSSLVRDWLSRSGQLPLSICISFGPMQRLSREVTEETISLAEIINQYSARWYHFDLSSPAHVARYFRAKELHAPILESFRLDSGDPNIHFVTCPRVQKVHLMNGRYNSFSWNNVTHISVESMFLEDCLRILRNAPLLVHAELKHVHWAKLPPSGRIITPLKSLKVGGMDHFSLFLHITCPALDELILDWRTSFQFIEDFIVPFLAGSSQLRCLTILHHTRDSRFIDILRAVPSLTKLVLLSPLIPGVVAENILNILGIILSSQSNSSQPSFLPNLETFDYQGPFGYDPIYSLPPARNAAQSPLRFVKFDFYSLVHIPEDAIPLFLRLVERGVMVHVWSEEKDILQASINYWSRRTQ